MTSNTIKAAADFLNKKKSIIYLRQKSAIIPKLSHLLVVHLCKRSISFLAGSVPHFKLDNVLVQLDILSHEAASDRWFVSLAELARVVPNADASFADSHVSEKHDFVSDSWLVAGCLALGSHGGAERHVLELLIVAFHYSVSDVVISGIFSCFEACF